EDGHAVAAVLFGDVNPAGKLPLTFPMQTADLPANTPAQYPGEHGEVHYLEDVLVGYRYFNAHEIRPLFPFGHGLSYTTFEYEHLKVSARKVSIGELATTPVAVDFQVANTGRRAGQEIAELYVGLPSTAGMPQPPKQLKGFSKVMLAPGVAGRVHLELNARALAGWNTQTKSWEVRPGTCRIMAGSSSEDIRLKGEFTVVP
ncbi:MAG: fibronectin type III-like domain-contianing protein, partial [Verrucomicrobiae bacterium]|nr:fibronectin type III-like domain-contianing protein [Verrucomicrobiae bacterium]